MSDVPHELVAEFPEHIARLRELKATDHHFSRLAAEYHDVNRAIHRLEKRIEGGSEEREEALRRRRVALKDEIAARLVDNNPARG